MDGFVPQPPPRRGEWRRHVREAAQSVDAFRASAPPRRGAIVIQPFAGTKAPSALLDGMRAYAEAFFGLPARVAAPIADFDEARHPQRGQTNAAMVLARLADVAAPGAVTLALLSEDLFAPGIRWLFGQSVLGGGLAAISTARYADPDARVFRRRGLKLFSHEAAHALGLAHCLRWRCAMQGSNSLEEDDAHPMHLCPDCLEKLLWATGSGRNSRYAALAGFYRGVGLEAEAAWCAERAREGAWNSGRLPYIMEAATGRGNRT